MGETYLLGQALMFVGAHPQLTGTAALVLGSIAVWLAWLAFNRLLDRRDVERRSLIDSAAAQHKELMDEIRAYRSSLERQITSGNAQNQAALAKLNEHVDGSVKAFQDTALSIRELEGKIDYGLQLGEATQAAVANVKSELEHVHRAVSIIRGTISGRIP